MTRGDGSVQGLLGVDADGVHGAWCNNGWDRVVVGNGEDVDEVEIEVEDEDEYVVMDEVELEFDFEMIVRWMDQTVCNHGQAWPICTPERGSKRFLCDH